jgi:bifunctional DNase/RNase
MVDEVQVEVWRLVQDEGGKDVLLLRDERRRHLPIWIGPCEAAAIWVKLAAPQSDSFVRRPMTHDLCTTIIERLGGRIERIVIDDFSNDTYYAKIHLALHGEALTVDSRPSDAVALALRSGAPVWVRDDVMAAGNIALEEEDSSAADSSDGDYGAADEDAEDES